MPADCIPPSTKRKRQCSFCSRVFSRTEHLERHVRGNHTHDKPFRCMKCSKSYSRQDTLTRHQRNNCGGCTPLLDGDHPLRQCSEASGDTTVATNANATSSLTGRALDSSAFDFATAIPTVSDSLLDFDMSVVGPLSSETPLSLPGSHGIPIELPADATWNFNFSPDTFDWMNDEFCWDDITTPIRGDSTVRRQSEAHGNSHPESVNVTSASVRSAWFTQTTPIRESQPVSGTATPTCDSPQADVDDGFLQALHTRFPTCAFDQALPSSDFLNLCVRAYFSRFQPIFPVIHVATFRPSKANSTLLLSICSIGSLFTGSASAAKRGAHIFERLNKAVVAIWDTPAPGKENTAMVQAALLGQTFGMLSGNPRHLDIVDQYHGSVIAKALRSKMGQVKHETVNLEGLSDHELRQAWRRWAKREEIVRIIAGLHIHDAEVAALFHHNLFLRHEATNMPGPAPDEVFMAAEPHTWRVQMRKFATTAMDNVTSRKNPTVDNNTLAGLPGRLAHTATAFDAYVRLESLAANIIEKRLSQQLGDTAQRNAADALVSFYESHLRDLPCDRDTFGLKVLWHLCFITMSVDLDLLERAIGRESATLSAADHRNISDWAISDHAQRTKLHAFQILRRLDTLPLGLEPAIHLPRAIFTAAICLYCSFRYGSSRELQAGGSVEFPELVLLGAGGLKEPAIVHTTLDINEVLCRLADILQRLGHWDIARKFATIIGLLIHQ